MLLIVCSVAFFTLGGASVERSSVSLRHTNNSGTPGNKNLERGKREIRKNRNKKPKTTLHLQVRVAEYQNPVK